MKISIDKKYTSGGQAIKILCMDRNDYTHYTYKVVGLCEDGDIRFFSETGYCSTSHRFNLVEVWEPTENEWCLFWDCNDSQYTILTKFKEKTVDGMFKTVDGYFWNYCDRFTGTLPEHLKGK
jgi:hypothetical protein